MGYSIFIIFYLLQAFLVWNLALKMGEKRAWFAWIPFAGDYLVSRLARKSFVWWILFYVPVVNIYIAYIFWSEIMRRFNKYSWLALFMFIPFVNWLILVLLGFVFKYPERQDDMTATPENLPPKSEGEERLLKAD